MKQKDPNLTKDELKNIKDHLDIEESRENQTQKFYGKKVKKIPQSMQFLCFKIMYTLMSETFAEGTFATFADFGHFRENLFPRKIFVRNRESLFSQNCY